MSILFDTTRREVKRHAEDGKYKGKIDFVSGREWNGKKYVIFDVLIKDGEGDIKPNCNIPLDWNEGGKLENILRKLDALPQHGGGIDVDKLNDLPVIVEVKNNYKNGIRYSNIVDIEKLEEQGSSEVQNQVKKDRSRRVKITPKSFRKKPIVAPVPVTDYEEEIEEAFED